MSHGRSTLRDVRLEPIVPLLDLGAAEYDERGNFYWTSSPLAQHSRNIDQNGKAFLAAARPGIQRICRARPRRVWVNSFEK